MKTTPRFDGFLKKGLETGFSITVEIPPPKGANPEKLLKIAEAVSRRVTGVNVTDNQRGMMRMSALAFCHLLTDVGCEPVLQLCCRDRNRLAIESDLLGAAALGIKNICTMTGDYPTLGDRPGAKPVFDLDSVQLVRLVKRMSDGFNAGGKAFKNHPSFNVGAVINPFYEPLELEIMKTKKKIKAGAAFFQTQPFFDEKPLEIFLDRVKEMDSKFLIGVTPLKSEKMVKFLNENVLTTPIPDNVARRMSQAADPAKEGLKIAAEFINAVRGKIDGVHIMPVGQTGRLPELLDMIDA
ncbi:MAG: 5,10-methylenetetrahydrofolate reductase [bacterium]|nr:MAG: 5,10-methylenetetrahydrofolate reductase [bacterium]